MFKRCVNFAVAVAFAFAPAAYAGEVSETPPSNELIEEEEIHVTQVQPEVKQVGKAASEGLTAAQARHIQNICLAVGVVAIAVTTIVLVRKHHKHHHH